MLFFNEQHGGIATREKVNRKMGSRVRFWYAVIFAADPPSYHRDVLFVGNTVAQKRAGKTKQNKRL